MRATHVWHHTKLGRVCRWLGSIQLAVPVLALVAVALAWGTYLESTRDARTAKAVVYGSWWFMSVMVLVCVSLVFAAVVRIPWQRRHVGFLVVHASLVALIIAGFTSLYGRVEGNIGLQEGSSTQMIEMDQEVVELLEHDASGFRLLGEANAPGAPGALTLGGFPVRVNELWPNVREEFDVADDGPSPYRAVQIAFGPVKESAVWIGDEARGESPVIDGLRVRVLAAGSAWTPPAPGTPTGATHAFIAGGKTVPLGEPGQEVAPGWKVTRVSRFVNATVGPDGLTEDKSKPANPAVEVVVTSVNGTVERHTVFEQFGDMVLFKRLAGEEQSGLKLVATPGTGPTGEETLVVYGQPPAIKLGYVGRDGSVKQAENGGAFPWSVELGSRRLTVLQQFTKANEHSRFVKAPPGKDNRPALLVTAGDTTAPLAWKGMLPVTVGGRVAVLRFGPRTHAIPFTLRLEDFRKVDYPGTEMAMAYESDVAYTTPSGSESRATISMNQPLVEAGWKVYQSGFVGDHISVFSVMRDPGLTLTYISCTTLCIGILITFYGRGLSWGHPGIPVPFSRKEQPHAQARADRSSPDAPAHHGDRPSEPAATVAGTPG